MSLSTTSSPARLAAASPATRAWPLLAALGLHLALAGLLLRAALAQTGGHLIYGLDDAYIHLAIAKHLALNGVWGATPYEFSSSSSSPLWTALLAGSMALFGPNTAGPLLLNLGLSTLLLLWLHQAQTARGLPPWHTFLTLAAVLVLAPIPPLVFSGMEHVLQILVVLVFVDQALRTMADRADARARWLALLLAPLLTLTRYEGLFVALPVCLLLLGQRRVRQAVALGILALLPVVVYGLISWSHGWYLLPNSVLLKGSASQLSLAQALRLLAGLPALQNLLASPHLVILLALALLAQAGPRVGLASLPAEGRRALWLFVAITLLHLDFAAVGWFFRYEAYLVALGLVLLSRFLRLAGRGANEPGPSRDRRRPLRVAPAVILGFAVLILPLRATVALWETPIAAHNIFEQQYQMARFIQRFYAGRAIAANDIGLIDYLADVRCLDLVGLGSLEVAQLRREDRLNAETIRAASQMRGVQVALLYDQWFTRDGASLLPPEWTRVGQWRIRDNVVEGGSGVAFYAVDPAERAALAEHLRQFAPELPDSVEQSGAYLEGMPG